MFRIDSLMLVLTLAACTGEATVDDIDATTDDPGVPATDSGEAPKDNPSSDDDDETAVPDDTGTPNLDPARQADPCGTDLNVLNGTVRPQLGTVPTGLPTPDLSADAPFDLVETGTSLDNPVRGRDDVDVTLYLPSADGNTPGPGPFPVVLFMPGFSTPVGLYPHLSSDLARWGFAVVTVQPANVGFTDDARHDLNAEEVLLALDWALAESPWAARLDGTKVAASGHSQGGKLSFYAASLDDRIDLAIGYDPQNGGGPPCAVDDFTSGDCNAFPVAPNCEAEDGGRLWEMQAETLVFAAEDNLLTPDRHLRARAFYRGAPSPAHLVRMPDVGHAAWITDGDASQVSRRVVLALLFTRFGGITGLQDSLPGGAWLGRQRIVTDHRSK